MICVLVVCKNKGVGNVLCEDLGVIETISLIEWTVVPLGNEMCEWI